jgi:MFS-type transporter involved in bile tolerance (Atg22 family)
MTNAVLIGLSFAVTGLIFAILVNVIGNRQDREAKRRRTL